MNHSLMAASESSLSHVESDVCFGGIEVFLLCAVEWQFFVFFSLNQTVLHIMQMWQVEADFTVYCHSNCIQTIGRKVSKNDKPTGSFTVW